MEGHAEQMRKDGRNDEAQALLDEMDKHLAKDDFESLKQLIITHNIKCAISDTANWTDIRQFNLMFSTEFGSVSSESNNKGKNEEGAEDNKP